MHKFLYFSQKQPHASLDEIFEKIRYFITLNNYIPSTDLQYDILPWKLDAQKGVYKMPVEELP